MYAHREVHPVNILTPPHSTLAVCWITNPSSSSYVSQRVFHQVVSEVMILDIEMLCPGSHLGYLCYLNCSFIVLKDFTMDLAWLCIDLDPPLLSLF